MNGERTARSIAEVKKSAVPSQLQPAAGDEQAGPSSSITDNPVARVSNVISDSPNHHCVNLYASESDGLETTTRPFIHAVELKGKKGIAQSVKGLFDEGAMVNSICNRVFRVL